MEDHKDFFTIQISLFIWKRADKPLIFPPLSQVYRCPRSGDLKAISTPSRLRSMGWVTTVRTWQRSRLTLRYMKRPRTRTRPAGPPSGRCPKAAPCPQYPIKPSSPMSNSLSPQVCYPRCAAPKSHLLIFCTHGTRGALTCGDLCIFIYPVWFPILKISPVNVIFFLFFWSFFFCFPSIAAFSMLF